MLGFKKFLVAKKFMDKREGDLSRFFFEIICLTLLKILLGHPFKVSLISGIEKFYSQEG